MTTEQISYTVKLFRLAEKTIIDNPNKISLDLLRHMFSDCMHSHEEIHALYMDNSLRLCFTQQIATGGPNACVMNEPTLYTTALTQRALNIILIHNHPSGERRFSKADTNLAKRINEGCRHLSLTLCDFMVVTPDWKVLSARSQGLI